MSDNPYLRPDDPQAVMAHKNRFYGGRALIVLGGAWLARAAWSDRRRAAAFAERRTQRRRAAGGSGDGRNATDSAPEELS